MNKLGPLRCTIITRFFLYKVAWFPFLNHISPIPPPQHTYSPNIPWHHACAFPTRSIVWTIVTGSPFTLLNTMAPLRSPEGKSLYVTPPFASWGLGRWGFLISFYMSVDLWYFFFLLVPKTLLIIKDLRSRPGVAQRIPLWSYIWVWCTPIVFLPVEILDLTK